MRTRLGYYADKVIELGWLAAVVIVPLYFNVFSSRVFEPDKISLLRSLVTVMTIAWLVKLLEGGSRAMRSDNGNASLQSAAQGAAQAALPSWLGILRVPMVVPILIYALAYLISSIFTITPDPTWWGSYQRLQGTYSQYSYMMLGLLVIANLRTRSQLERLINFMLLTSIPVALYGIVQWLRFDPLPWAGDTSSRVASTMGNAIFVAAWLIMVVPLAVYRLFSSIVAWFVTSDPQIAPEPDRGDPRSQQGRPRAAVRPANLTGRNPQPGSRFGWAVVANIFGVLLIQAFMFWLTLKLMAGLPYPDARMWWVLPSTLILFYLGCWAIAWLTNHADSSAQSSIIMVATGVALFLAGFLALPFQWSLARGEGSTINVVTDFNPGALLWVSFFMLLWGAFSAGLYALFGSNLMSAALNPGGAIIRFSTNVGYAVLLLLQLGCIYLTQSRGPWLGFGIAVVTFAVSMWLVGYRRNVVWMKLLGGVVSAILLVIALFVGALNIPDSPLKAVNSLPVLGRGFERLSTLTRTEDGTGKVRELIWDGATKLIVSDPVRALIGWGPEAMYVAYSPFYPAELAHWELRNATPDRSHNVEFDQLVTMGLVGLVTYYFLVGSFFYYGIKTLKRTTGTRDQLLVIALLSAMAAHFMEIQFGIQIAATWSYFYLLIGLMVVFGFYINGYLRADAVAKVAVVEPLSPQALANGDASTHDGDTISLSGDRTPPALSGTAPLAATTQQSNITTAVRTGGNGKGSRNIPPPPPPGASKSRSSSSGAQGLTAGQAADARRRQAQMQVRQKISLPWLSNPILAVLYVVLLIATLIFAWMVNVATVQADIQYKQGLSYDSAQLWPQSIGLYQNAIALQPNQDYYYLFLGRAWLEFAKQVDQERAGTSLVQGAQQADPGWPQDGNWRVLYKVPLDVQCPALPRTYGSDADRQTERVCRLRQSEAVLLRAHALNPLNTDHYANLGRLYLYWADSAGAADKSKSKLAVENFEMATRRTPGNAQLWDELAVAYARNNQFNKAIETLNYSQTQVDTTYGRTPYLRGQLYQERALNVKDTLQKKDPLPADGETDYGKLVLESAKAYSETIGLDDTQFLDTSMKVRVEFFMDAALPFTATNSTVSPAVVGNVITSTIIPALDRRVAVREKDVATFLRNRGVYSDKGDQVPATLLQKLWSDPDWAGLKKGGTAEEWLDNDFDTVAHYAMLPHSGLGYIYSRIGDKDKANTEYQRALALEPTDQELLKDIKPTTPQK